MNFIDSMLNFLGKKSVVITDSGSIDSREWIKFSDGTAICICRALSLERTPISTRFGKPLYMAEIEFPKDLFIGIPVVNGGLYSTQGSLTVNMDTTTTKDSVKLYSIVDVNAGTSVLFSANFIASGKWK